MQNDVTNFIAQKIRELRVQKGVTLQTLSDRTSLSKGLLSKIENSRTIPSLPVFLNLAHALGSDPSEFFQLLNMNGKKFLHVKKNAYQKNKKESRQGFEYEFILSQSLRPCSMQSYLLTVLPKADSRPTTTDGFELKYIVHGHCEYQIGDDTILLEEGDSLFFDASQPHMPINKGKGKVVMLVLYFIRDKATG
jgi:transcriptional regulator with XRE-family HTH domain